MIQSGMAALADMNSKRREQTTRVDPLTSILDVMARSCQILSTSWQTWIPWQESYKDVTRIYHYSKMESYQDEKNSKISKVCYKDLQKWSHSYDNFFALSVRNISA